MLQFPLITRKSQVNIVTFHILKVAVSCYKQIERIKNQISNVAFSSHNMNWPGRNHILNVAYMSYKRKSHIGNII